MICTEFYNGQGLGNQLWLYAVTRVKSLDLKTNFGIIHPEKFKGMNFLDLNFGEQLIGGTSPEGGPPIELPNGIMNYYREPILRHKKTNQDVTEIDPNYYLIEKNTKIDGNFQSPSFIRHHKNQIRTWFKPVFSDGLIYDENLCVINFRGGEYIHMRDVFLPKSYWTNARRAMLELNSRMEFRVVTDDYRLAAKFFDKSEIVRQEMSYDYLAVLNAKFVILSNSSFGWFPAWLNSNAKSIIVPKYWWGYNNSEYWATGSIKTEGFTYLDNQGVLTETYKGAR